MYLEVPLLPEILEFQKKQKEHNFDNSILYTAFCCIE
jgi:hypothetical protein